MSRQTRKSAEDQGISDLSDTTPNDSRPAGQRRALIGAGVGTLVEFYDFAIYALTVPIIAARFFPEGDPGVALISAFAVYGVAFVVRPLGGIVFGAIGDRHGRRRVLALVLMLIGISTALIGVLPSYADVGLLAPILLVALRLLQGLSAGGEVTSATSFALEHAPSHRRALWITIVIATSAVSSLIGLAVVLGLNAGLSEEAFNSWGWRIPFLLALPLSMIGLYVRLRTEESPAFEHVKRSKTLSSAPVREAFADNASSIAFAFALASMTGLTFYYLAGYFPTYLQVSAGLSRSAALVTNGVGLLAFAIAMPIFGTIADRHGRRPMIRVGAVLLVVTSVPAFILAGSGGLVSAVLGQLIVALSLSVFGGGSYTALLELFPTRTRVTGAAIGYNLGYAIFGGTAPLLATVLVQATGSAVAPGYYLSAIAIVVALCTFRIPETRTNNIND
ncbi:MAG: MFS transporter [Nocardioidaceae bacterium]